MNTRTLFTASLTIVALLGTASIAAAQEVNASGGFQAGAGGPQRPMMIRERIEIRGNGEQGNVMYAQDGSTTMYMRPRPIPAGQMMDGEGGAVATGTVRIVMFKRDEYGNEQASTTQRRPRTMHIWGTRDASSSEETSAGNDQRAPQAFMALFQHMFQKFSAPTTTASTSLEANASSTAPRGRGLFDLRAAIASFFGIGQ